MSDLAAPAPGTSLGALIATQARHRPHATAVVDRTRRLRYAELDRQANRLAHHLATKPLHPGAVVGLALEPSCQLAVALLALWRAGAVPLMLDPTLPMARLQRMVDDAGCGHVITLCTHAHSWRGRAGCVVHLDAEQPWIARQPSRAPSIAPSELACLLYTSGTTGQPKGVPISQRALVNKLTEPGAWGRLDASCSALWHGSPAFDASLAQLLLPLVHGGRVRALDSQERLDPRRVWEAMHRHRTTVLDATPSWLLAMLDAARPLPALGRVVLGGEILTPALAHRVRKCFPATRIVNVYGPTEACIDATAHELSDSDFGASAIPIGHALPGYTVRLLDAALRPVAGGEAGEICIGGVGVAAGYWRCADANAARFVADAQGVRWYRTGDLGRCRADGTFEFLGRHDGQLKLRGQRVELGEIEAVLSGLPGVAAAVVRTWPAPGAGDPQIAGYVVLGADIPVATLQERLRQELPAIMVPTTLTVLADLPLTATGKVDRATLPPPAPPVRAAAEVLGPIERDLLTLWRDLLNAPALGVHDNFFEHGGNSLAAVSLAQAIGQRFGRELPLSLLLDSPTVADLALALAGAPPQAASGRVLRLGRGDGPPLFLLPPGSGVGLVYAGLARELTPAVPCIALQAIGFAEPPATLSMDTLAARFADDVEQIQPAGDIRLCGYSAGGAIALEMARQLAQRGRRVALLALLDPYFANLSDSPRGEHAEDDAASLRSSLRDMAWDALGLRGNGADLLADVAAALLHHGLAQRGADLSGPTARRLMAQARRALPATMPCEVFLLLVEGSANIWRAHRTQRIAPLAGFDGEAWFVQPEADEAAFRAARAAHWRRLVGDGLKVHMVPGEHATLLRRAASVAAMGALLRAVLAPGAIASVAVA